MYLTECDHNWMRITCRPVMAHGPLFEDSCFRRLKEMMQSFRKIAECLPSDYTERSCILSGKVDGTYRHRPGGVFCRRPKGRKAKCRHRIVG
ncbi:hypothetical protein CEXT_287601 [Caerostris extrusa]|uniref:Uncharacterized protein n=1 Tax=Caerostris extrusa TaxID=172846 RepID=A0AAV4QAT5_CAEEX|nr:hypothetical protein CEXT_287601 [Caerostris extrusa]